MRCKHVALGVGLLLLHFLNTGRAEDFSCLTNDGTVTITAYSGAGGAVYIPDTLANMPVTAIGDRAFRLNSTIHSVSISGNVTNIGFAAFDQCLGLTNISISHGCKKLGDFAFSRCEKLASVALPNSLTTIGTAAFKECATLPYLTVPGGVTCVGDGAFSGCLRLTDVSLPNSLITIGPRAFASSGLLGISIPDSVMNIGEAAFQWCRFTTIEIPGSVRAMGSDVFNACPHLAAVYFLGDAPVLGGPLGSAPQVFYRPGTFGAT